MRLVPLVLIAALFASVPAAARLQPDIVCLDPDIEFPVACDEED